MRNRIEKILYKILLNLLKKSKDENIKALIEGNKLYEKSIEKPTFISLDKDNEDLYKIWSFVNKVKDPGIRSIPLNGEHTLRNNCDLGWGFYQLKATMNE